MKTSTLSSRTVGFGYALAIASVLNAILVVVKEKSPTVMSMMKKISGHHWTTHVMIVLGLFFGVGGLLSIRNSGKAETSVFKFVLSGVILSFLIIAGFYLFCD